MQKAKVKKSSRHLWSEDEVKLLKKLYPDGGAGEIAERIGRPLTAVRQKAYNMGIRTSEHRFWSANEIRHLKRLYPSETIQSIADKLERSYRSVVAKAYKLGLTEELRVWSKRELNLLKKLYPSRTAQEIADQLVRSVQATRLRIHQLGLKKRRPAKKNLERMTKRYYKYEEKHRTVKGVKQKRCPRCKKWKSETQYHKQSKTNDRLRSWCKDCELEYKRERNRKMGKGLKTYRRYEEYHRVVSGVKQKKCTRCKRWKTESEFYKTKRNKDGLQFPCKACLDKATNKSRNKRRSAVKG